MIKRSEFNDACSRHGVLWPACGRDRPNYGARYRYGEPISTGFVESMVDQIISGRF